MAQKDHEKYFESQHQQKDLKKQSLRSGAVTLASQGIMFFIQLGSTMILARILTPQDYGMMAMVVAITGLAGILSNLGLSTATIQRAKITHEQVSTLFWINAGIGALITLVVASLSPVVAWFYKTPDLVWVMLALSSNFLINGLAVQHGALLNRQMRFYSLAKIQVFSTLIGIVSAIFAAYHGLGYWALVINSLVTSVMTVAGTWFSSRWIPGSPRRSPEVKSMVNFGSDIVGFNVINYFSRNLDNILIGRYHGSAALGMYSKAYQLLMMPITNLRDPMNKVAMPALSRLQNDPEQYRKYYIKYVSLLSFLSMPLVVFLFVFSENIILIVLGDQWMGASILFKILAIVSFIQPANSTRGLVLLTTGRSRRYLWLGGLVSLTFCISFAIGVMWGPVGVAYAYAISTYLFLFPYMAIGFHKTPVSIKDFVFAIHRPAIASIFMGLACYGVCKYLVGLNDFYLLVISLVFSIIIYVLFFVLLPGGRNEFKDYLSYGRNIL